MVLREASFTDAPSNVVTRLIQKGREANMEKSLVLAITTIEDLLLNRVLTEFESDNLGMVNLSIPDYQRPYKWTEKNAIQLLDDIIDAKGDNRERYRVGTLILHRRTDVDESTYDIVDGQQRVITFSLLLSAFGKHPEFLQQKLADNPDSRRNVPGNYRALKRRIDSISEPREKNDLEDYITKNCEFIVVITDDRPEAFQFFDSQNARGKKLYPHDLLKAFHLREMRNSSAGEVEEIVREWEDQDQKMLSALFSDYLYCIKRWVRGNRANSFSEHDIQVFKGVNQENSYPYAQFYKGAYSYARTINDSSVPFVMGIQNLRPFQLDAPIIAGRPFFEYAAYYFDILRDIQDNDKYEGYFINGNPIVKTLDYSYKNGTGNRIARRLFDSAVLLYVDRFCPGHPNKQDLVMFEEFVKLAFIWAYSLRAQYVNLGWWQAENYIMGAMSESRNPKKNSFNIYKTIVESDTPRSLLGALSERMELLSINDVLEGSKGKKSRANNNWAIDGMRDETYVDYLHFFKEFNFLEVPDEH